MHDRSNGLGGGFAGYGIYPEYAQCYAFHLFYDDENSRETCEQYLKRYFDIASMSLMPVRRSREITDAPIIWRYFVQPKAWRMEEEDLDEKAYTARHVLEVNSRIDGAYIFSSGKNMGVFKEAWDTPRIWGVTSAWRIPGRLWTATDAIPPHARLVGGAHPLPCWM